MTKKATSIWAYVGWVGFIIAMCQPCKDECRFHLNKGLVWNIFTSALAIVGLIGIIPWVGWILDIFVFGPLWIFLIVVWIVAFVAVCKQQEKEMPIIGRIHIIK